MGDEATETNAVILPRGGKWVLYSADGTKVLGTFDSESAAKDREREIIASKASKIERYAEVPSVCIFEHTPGEDPYNEEALDAVCANFSGEGVRGRIYEQIGEPCEVPLVIGHEEDQDILRNSGIPAAGWVKGVWRDGRRLMARIADVPEIVAEAIKKKIYRTRSAEIYRNYKDLGPALRRVALLGGDIPAKKTLGEMVFQTYREDGLEVDSIHQYAEGVQPMTAEEIKALQDEKAAVDKELAELKAKLVEMEAAGKEGDDKGEDGKDDKEPDGFSELKLEVSALRKTNEEQARVLSELRSRAVELEAERFAEEFCARKGLHLVDARKTVADAHRKLHLSKFSEGEDALSIFKATLDKLVVKPTEDGMKAVSEKVLTDEETAAEKRLYDAWAEENLHTDNDRKLCIYEWWQRVNSKKK